jgi:uncharacterized protein (TIGR03067 family)
MRRWIVPVAAIVVSAIAATGSVTDAQSQNSLKGTWQVLAAQRNARIASDMQDHQLTFSGNRFDIRSQGGVLYQGTFQVDASKKPATIDFRHTAGKAKGQTWRGIYELDGDTLKICDNAADVSKPRPSAFVSEEGQVLVDFKRAKP